MTKLDVTIRLYDEEIEQLKAFVDYQNEVVGGIHWTLKEAIKVLFIHRLQERIKDLELS